MTQFVDRWANRDVLTLQPYQAGKPIEELERELGITDVIKLASNENPRGPGPAVHAAIARASTALSRYPDGSGYRLKHALARHLGVRCRTDIARQRFERPARTRRTSRVVARKRRHRLRARVRRLSARGDRARRQARNGTRKELDARSRCNGAGGHRQHPNRVRCESEQSHGYVGEQAAANGVPRPHSGTRHHRAGRGLFRVRGARGIPERRRATRSLSESRRNAHLLEGLRARCDARRVLRVASRHRRSDQPRPPAVQRFVAGARVC